MNKTNLTNLCVVLVLVVWSGSVVLGWYDRSYKVSATVELAMASVVGYLLGAKFLKVTDEKVITTTTSPKTEKKRWYERS